MKKILNLTQHDATLEQMEAGVIEPASKAEIKTLLTFNEIPTIEDMKQRAERLASLSQGYTYAMIGGAPYFMSTIEHALKCRGITPLYAFSQRVSVENNNPDGTVTKTFIFRHEGFVQV